MTVENVVENLVEEKPVEQNPTEKPVDQNPVEPVEKPNENPEPHKNRVQARIDKLTREKYELKGRLEAYEAMQKQQQGNQQQPAAPLREQFGSDEEYFAAAIQHGISQELPKVEARLQSRVNQAQSSAGWGQNVGTFQKEHADFFEVLKQADDIPVPASITSAITTSPNGPAIMYDLCKNPDELERIANLPPMAAAREIGIIEARLTGSIRKQVSSAKPPIKPVNGGSSVVDIPEDKLSDKEWMAKYGTKARMKQSQTT